MIRKEGCASQRVIMLQRWSGQQELALVTSTDLSAGKAISNLTKSLENTQAAVHTEAALFENTAVDLQKMNAAVGRWDR